LTMADGVVGPNELLTKEIKQLLTKAKKVENREALIANKEHLHKLVVALGSEDQDLILSALRVISLLISDSSYRKRLATQPQLLSNVKQQMIAIDNEMKVKQLAIQIYTCLSSFAPSEEPSPSPSSPAKSTSDFQPEDVRFEQKEASLEDVSLEATSSATTSKSSTAYSFAGASCFSRTPLTPFHLTTATSQSAPHNLHLFRLGENGSSTSSTGLAILTSNVPTKLNNAQTYTIFIKGLNSAERKGALERTLVGLKGVISFSIFAEKAIIRTTLSEDELKKAIRSVGLIPNSRPEEDNKENSPKYCTKERTRVKESKGKIVPTEYNRPSESDENAGWFGRVARALWG
jgi:hypothetical protein